MDRFKRAKKYSALRFHAPWNGRPSVCLVLWICLHVKTSVVHRDISRSVNHFMCIVIFTNCYHMITSLERELDVQAAILRRFETPVTETRGSSWELSTDGVDQVQQTGAPCPPPRITWFSPAPGAQQSRSVSQSVTSHLTWHTNGSDVLQVNKAG